MSLVEEAKYEIMLFLNTKDIEKNISKLKEAFLSNEILVTKQAKNRKEEEIDIKPLIIELDVNQESFNSIKISCHSLAGSKNNLNPNYIVQVCKNVISEEELEDYNIHRKELILA